MTEFAPENTRWLRAVNEEVADAKREVSTLETDISTRFSGLSAMVQSLGEQVDELSAYALATPVTRVDYMSTSGWATSPAGWGTKVSVVIPSPPYPCAVNVYAAAHAHVLSGKPPGGGVADQFYNGMSRIRIAGVNSSAEVPGFLIGPDGIERWGMGMSHTGVFRTTGNSFTVTYDIYNGNDYNSDQTDAMLGVITTFIRAI